MRTMASVWVYVIVVIAVQHVLGDHCLDLKNSDNISCDDCIRCGGSWCRSMNEIQCVFSKQDSWCPNDQECFDRIPVDQPGDHNGPNPVYAERTLYINSDSTLEIKYPAVTTGVKAKMEIINSTQPGKITLKEMDTPKCNDQTCTTYITATPHTDFCSSSGTIDEFVFVKISFGGLKETAMVKYHVPCACGCSGKVEQNSPYCFKNGNNTCGVCSCYPGWTGEDCSEAIEGFFTKTKSSVKTFVHYETSVKGGSSYKGSTRPDLGSRPDMGSTRPDLGVTVPSILNTTTSKPVCSGRGDIPSCRSPINDLKCSGNGYCNECDECICYTDKEGSQYFDPKDYCTDLCMVVSDCDFCIVNNTIGKCDGCMLENMVLYTEKYNASRLDERDLNNNKMWVNCNETVNDCFVRYVAKRDDDGNIFVMVVESCNDVNIGAVTSGPKVPLILGILGILAAVAAVAGVLIWKHMNALPPVPLNDPGYQNIDAEDCIGENPLYKPPTSSFKNPTYGKW